MSINVVVIGGNLTRDAELRSTKGGTQVLAFGVAVNERRKNQQSGEWEDVPNYVDCTLFGNRAGAIARYMTKGTRVCVSGHLRWHQWEARDGSKRSKLDVVAEEIQFSSRGGSGGAGGEQGPVAAVPPVADAYDEGIPF